MKEECAEKESKEKEKRGATESIGSSGSSSRGKLHSLEIGLRGLIG